LAPRLDVEVLQNSPSHLDSDSTRSKADLPFWLCDVVRVLEAVDEEASQITIFSEKTSGEKRYSPPGLGESVVFREDVVGSAHVFRLTHTESSIFCDQEFKDACKAAGLKGVRFREALNL
jgi:hypothetical protein